MRTSLLHSTRVYAQPFTAIRPSRTYKSVYVKASAGCPKASETARTIVSICNEGTLSTISTDGTPIGTPIAYSLNKTGQISFQLASNSVELGNLKRDSRCSISIQPTSFPARAVASITLVGKVESNADSSQGFSMSKCLYFGGLDQLSQPIEVSAEDYSTSEPDVLRNCAAELVASWNNDRAEDVYRIVSEFLGVQLTEMAYAELVWVDHLGMYVKSEVQGQAPCIVRVPFYRPVLDERDARSVITMAAQIAWEKERPYTPSLPSIYSDAAAN